MTKIPYTKESARKLWTEARDKYQMQLDSKKQDFEQDVVYNIDEIFENIEYGISELERFPEKYAQYEPENKWGTVNSALESLKSLKNCILEQDINMKYLYMRW